MRLAYLRLPYKGLAEFSEISIDLTGRLHNTVA